MPNFKTKIIAEGFYCIEQGFVRSFLIEGDKAALLVDTGVGGDNLKEYVENITKLPITVVFTHSDGDHVGDAGMFERRFMHPSEFARYRSKTENAVSMQPIWEGDVIDLGKYCFEVLLLPGHTPGNIALLEREKRFLIGGDTVQIGEIFMFGEGRDFDAFRASMKKLESMSDEFNIVYASHHVLEVPTETIPKLYELAGLVMENKIAGVIAPDPRFEEKVKVYKKNGLAFYAE